MVPKYLGKPKVEKISAKYSFEIGSLSALLQKSGLIFVNIFVFTENIQTSRLIFVNIFVFLREIFRQAG